MEEQEKRQQKEKAKDRHKKFRVHFHWLTWGLIFSLLASVLFTVCYSLFCNRNVEDTYQEQGYPLEQQEVMDWLMKENYVIYRDLVQKQTSEPVSYLDLYIAPNEGCEWVLNENYDNAFQDIPDDVVPSAGNTEGVPTADAGRVYSYLNYLEESYFPELEELFEGLNYTFEYYCEDLDTGTYVSNSDKMSIVKQKSFFYLSFLFDEYGNCAVENAIFAGDDGATLMRRSASAAARSVRLDTDPNYLSYDNEAQGGLYTYLSLERPKNCRMIYNISMADWARFEQGELLELAGLKYPVGPKSVFCADTGSMHTSLCFLMLAVMAAACYCPLYTEAGLRPRKNILQKALEMPLELFLLLGYCGLGLGFGVCIDMALGILSGDFAGVLVQNVPRFFTGRLAGLASYLAVLLVQTLVFFFAWLLGTYLGQIRGKGIREFVKRRSLIYRFFPFVKARVKKFYSDYSHIDLTKNAKKMILRLVLVNAVILFLIGSLWFGGFAVAFVYSILLYFVLRKYVTDLQTKYGLLLKATNEIAEGNLNVQIQEDLGVFEPFKPQFYRIQEGFKRAVEEEVKSQRMKAELITNVSHDLKTPLTAIITYIKLLQEENVTEEQRKEYLDTLERKSLRLKVLIEDLFEVSKANSQNMTLNLMDVDIMNLVKQVAVEMGDKLVERNLDLRMALPEDKVVLPLDSQRTYRIYENLFGNIAKYAMPGTRVYVNGFRVEDRVMITLKNITAEEIAVKPEELTDRFVRGDTSRNTEGSGLGLAIAKSFTELQGGELEIEVDGDLFKVTTVWRSGSVSCSESSGV